MSDVGSPRLTRRKRLIIILSDRYTVRTQIAVRPSLAQAWKVTWYPDTRQQNEFAGDHIPIGSKQRPPCRTWKEPSFVVGTFLSSLNSFISQNQGGRRSRNLYWILMPSNVASSTDLWIRARPAIGCYLEQRDLDAVSFASRPLCLERPCCILQVGTGLHTLIGSLYSVAIWSISLNKQEHDNGWKKCTIWNLSEAISGHEARWWVHACPHKVSEIFVVLKSKSDSKYIEWL